MAAVNLAVLVAVQTVDDHWQPLDIQHRPLGDGALADDVEVILYTLGNHAGILPQLDVYLPDPGGPVFLGHFFRNVQNALGDG